MCCFVSCFVPLILVCACSCTLLEHPFGAHGRWLRQQSTVTGCGGSGEGVSQNPGSATLNVTEPQFSQVPFRIQWGFSSLACRECKYI